MSASIRVLYLDDSRTDRELVRHALQVRERGFEITEADSRAEFEKQLGTRMHDVVVTDYHLPGFTALEVLEIVRAANEEVPVLVVTGTGSEQLAVAAMKRGAADYLVKSADGIENLPAAIRAAVSRDRRHGERRHTLPPDTEFRATFEKANVGVAHVSFDGRFLRVNQKLCEILGHPAGELVGEPFARYTHPGDLEASREVLEKIRSGAQARSTFCKRYLRKDGRTIWAELSVASAHDRAGADGYLITFLQDITARRQSEQLLSLEHSVARILAAETNTDAAVKAVLRAVCETHEWAFGRFWPADDAAGVLRAGVYWSAPSDAIARYVERSRARTFGSGIGLLGRAWETGRPVWIADAGRDPFVLQPDFATEAGLTTAILFPVRAKGGSLGVLAFASREIREPDAALHEAAEAISNQLGQFLQRAQGEEELRESEARFRSLTALSSDWYWEQDEACRFVSFSGSSAEKLWGGGGLRSLIGLRRWEIPGVEPVAGTWQQHRELVAARKAFRGFEYRFTAGDFGTLYFAVNGEPIFDADGRFKGYRGTATDMTAQKRAEESLRRFRIAMDNSADMILLIDRASMRYVDVNETVCRLLGYSRDEMLAMGPQDLLPQSRAELESAYDAIIGDPSVKSGLRSAYRCKDGSSLPFESTRHVLSSGGSHLIAAISRDIRGRLAQEQSVRESEARFRSLVALSSDYYWETDAELRQTLRSAGSSADSLAAIGGPSIGFRRWERPYLSPSHEEWMAHRADMEAHRPFRNFEFSRPGLDGREYHFSISGEPVFDAEGAFRGYRGVGAEITARKLAEAALRESERFSRMTLDALSKHICVLDERGTIIAVNRAWREFGAANGAHPGRTLEGTNYLEVCDAADHADAACFAEGVRSVLSGSAPVFQMEYACHSPAEKRWFHVRVSRFADSGPTRLIVVHDNISERMRSGEAIRRHARRQSLIAAFGQMALASDDLDELQDKLVELAARGLDAEFCRLLVADPETGSMVIKAGTGWSREWIGRVHCVPDQPNQVRFALEANEAVVVGDFSEETRFKPSSLLAKHAIVSCIEVPVPGTAGPYGLLGAFARERDKFSLDDVDFLQSLGNALESAVQRRRALERVAYLAQFDSLTALPNRNLFHDRLDLTLTHARRNESLTGLLFLDLDGFKAVNDTLGHGAGDELLKLVAGRLLECVRPGDTVSRLGGDEFAIILSNLAKADDAGLVAEKIIAACARPFHLDRSGTRTETFVSASVGIVLSPGNGSEPGELLKNADIAMYRAKEQGKNGYQYFLPEMHKRSLDRMRMEAELRGALARNEFVLHYQPKADLYSGALSGFEALLRWKHPERGLVPPFEFISILEDTSLIVPVGYWIIRSVCDQIAQWKARGLVPQPVAVNLSARQFQQRNLDATIGEILRETGVEPGLLEFELTESMVMEDAEEAIGVLKNLKAYGVRLSVDDFGTGYSSLAYLKRFPIDALKIDRAFIRDCTTDADDAVIALSIINLAHSLKLKVVAEGVETEAQLNFLRARGCDQLQGYYFARPMDAAAATDALAQNLGLRFSAAAENAQAIAILLVDDNADDLELFREALSPDGYRIVTARSPQLALDALAGAPADIVISDQRMPSMSGVDFLTAVGKLYPEAIRVMLTGSDNPNALPDAVNEARIHKYLSKHWDEDRLRLEVREACKLVLARRFPGG